MRSGDWSSDVCSSDLVQIVDVVARDDVFAVAVTILCLKGDARGKQSRNDGAADRAFGDDLIIVADAEAGVAGEIIRRAARRYVDRAAGRIAPIKRRSEEHTSELQSLMRNSYAVFCLKNK